MATIIARSAESVHWYRQDGKPQYTVAAKDGSQRPTTLRDARKMDLVPSVTTITKVVNKPALIAWQLEQMMLAAMTLPRVEGESGESFIQRVDYDSKATGRMAAEKGTRIHESIERHYKGEANVEHEETAKAFAGAVSTYFGIPPYDGWKTEQSFSTNLGYGGKIDLSYHPSEKMPHGIVLDAKSKEFGPDDKVIAYDENLMQLSAYRYGIGIPMARCANVFASRTHPGLIKILEWTEEDLQRGWKMFNHLLGYWKDKNKFGA